MSIMSAAWLRGVAYGLPIASIGILLVLFNAMSPARIGPLGVFLIFVLLYLFWLGVMFILLRIGLFILKKVHIKTNTKHSSERVSYYVASIFAFVPVLILALQSVGQLEIRDVLLVLVFASLAIFYVIKRS